MEYTKEELEEKFGVKIGFFAPTKAPLSQFFTGAYYDWETDTIVLNKNLSGKVRLTSLAHEIGHKKHFDELRKKGVSIEAKRTVENECEAWKRGLEIAKELDVVEAYKTRWRETWFPLSVICVCPFPGDDKMPSGFSIGKNAQYSSEEWGKLMKEYVKTGKWLGRKHLGITEHVT